jgi:guanylate kinase
MRKVYKPLLITGPSGAGKSTLAHHLLDHYVNNFKFSISSTTRKKREDEMFGIDYYFISKEEFEDVICFAKSFLLGNQKEQFLRIQSSSW